MKALRWYGKRDLRYEDMPEPSPGPGQVKIRVNMVGICGSDLEEYTRGPVGMDMDKVPLAMGHEFSGEIVELGEGVKDWKTGDRVTGVGYWRCGECYYCRKALYNRCPDSEKLGNTVDGCMAEYMVAPGQTLFKLPDSVPDDVAALVEPLSVAFHSMRQSRLEIGDSVAIVGDGTIGLCILLAARAAGASAVYFVSKHKARGEAARVMGATAIVNANDNPAEAIGNLTGGMGVDKCFECAGRLDTPQLAVNLTRNGGTSVIMGMFNQPSAFDFGTVAFTERIIMGSSMYTDEGKAIIALLADGRLDPRPLITNRVPLKDGAELGFEGLLANKDTQIKVLLQIP